MSDYVVLQPHSRTNHSSRFCVITSYGWQKALDGGYAALGHSYYDSYDEARKACDELNGATK